MATKAKTKDSGRPVTAALMLILIGGFFLVDRMNLIEFHWPLLLIAVGVLLLIFAIRDHKVAAEIFPSALFILVGLVLYAERATPWFHGGLSDAWPLLIVAIGVANLLGFMFSPKKGKGQLISGIVMILLGFFFFLVVFEYIMWSDISSVLTWWPVLLVGVGIYLLIDK